MDSQIISLRFYFLPAPPQYHEPFISSTIIFPICEPTFISPTSYRNSPMGPPPFISLPSTLCPTWANHITLWHPFLYLYISPNYSLFIVQMPLFPFITFSFCHHLWRLASFWPHTTHVTLGWSINYHLPFPTSSISSEYPTGHLTLSSEFVHFVPPLAQLITGLVVPLTLDLVTRLQPLFISYILQPRAVLSLPNS
jgi:hypothetical protein